MWVGGAFAILNFARSFMRTRVFVLPTGSKLSSFSRRIGAKYDNPIPLSSVALALAREGDLLEVEDEIATPAEARACSVSPHQEATPCPVLPKDLLLSSSPHHVLGVNGDKKEEEFASAAPFTAASSSL